MCTIILYSSRYFHWQLNLYLMLAMVIAIIPFYSAQLIVSLIRIGTICHNDIAIRMAW